jgi:transcriptional regulator with AAA-type ATPase domain/transcriptional regulatory protein LevR
MKRIDQVEYTLREYGKDRGVTATELAGRLGFARANVSNDLNRLCEEGKAVKYGTKPVYYHIAEEFAPLTPFDTLLRDNPSLARNGELAKAAVLYPPQGMHIMLLGETGVGKSMFAELIHEFAIVQKVAQGVSGVAFVSFNCADYANNPQLLISQLFGVVKGAYTGADTDKSGLLEQADGGILFLDEVHRLPPEGQEMLFTYIDQGSYRRLGETKGSRNVSVMLICATTESPESALLKTFIRRIPMLIKIPNLEERSVEERLALISSFFTKESQNLGRPIMVSVNSMRALLGYTCPGNIGQLKSDIQLLCALAYSDFLSRQRDSINIITYNLPPNIRNGLFQEKNRRKIWSMFAGISSRFISFDAFGTTPIISGKDGDGDIYNAIERRTEEMRRVGASQEQMDEVIGNIMANYYKHYGGETEREITGSIEQFVGAEIVSTVQKMLTIASQKLGRTFSDNVHYGLSLHLKSAIQRVRQGLPIINPRIKIIRQEIPEVLNAAQEALATVERDFNITLPLDEAGFVALFFASESAALPKRPVVQVIVVTHGTGIATGLAETANRLLGTDIIKGFDMPFDEEPYSAYLHIREYLKTQGGGAVDVLLLVDMGSLVNYVNDLEQDLRIRAKCIPMVSTLHVLEAGQKTLLGYSLLDVYEDTRRIALRFIDDLHTVEGPPVQQLYLLSICTTGEGSAKALQSYLCEKLDLKGICKIVTLQLADNRELNERVERLRISGRIIGVISAFVTGSPVPHYKISSSMTSQGIAQIQHRIDTETIFTKVEDNLLNTLVSFQGSTTIREIRSMLERIERALGIELSGEMLIGVFCHIGCMLDRLKHGESAGVFPGKQALLEKYPGESKLVKQECERLAGLFNVIIPLDEVCYILVFFTQESLL